MIDGFRPMLASPVDFDKLKYDDLYLSPKLDGIRAVVIDGVVMSRSLKPIPNRHVQKRFRHLEYYDGELIVGPANSPTVYRDTNSGVMAKDGDPDVRFHVFLRATLDLVQVPFRRGARHCFVAGPRFLDHDDVVGEQMERLDHVQAGDLGAAFARQVQGATYRLFGRYGAVGEIGRAHV